MDARTIISKLRENTEPTQAELNWFASGLASGAVSDAQAGAFAMAVCLNGLSEEGRVALTLAMRDSGDVLGWDLEGPVVDKHSTGGIGDCVSLLLAPMLAPLGVYVPMISGRGLGHTGGTLDKLEAIPGVSTDVSERRFREITREVGCAIVSATADIAPADRKLYAIRDVTATVSSVDLITASILSKKLAAGLDALILDVKTGSGAFMASADDARTLAKALVRTANGAGVPTAALLTDMNQPVVPAAGNALEIAEVMDALTSPRTSRLTDVSLALGAELLLLAGRETEGEAAAQKLLEVLQSGRAAETFLRMITALGGPGDFAETWRQKLPEANVIREVPASRDGVIAEIDGREIGMAVVRLGGGRMRESDRIDPSVGLDGILPLGAEVRKGAPVARIHASGERAAQLAEKAVLGAIRIEDRAEVPDLIRERIA